MMAYIRSKKIKGHTYYYVVEGNIDKRGKVKQKVLMYLGNIDHVLKVFKFYNSRSKYGICTQSRYMRDCYLNLVLE